MEEPLHAIDSTLFALLRDGVIIHIGQGERKAGAIFPINWECIVRFVQPDASTKIHRYESSVSALGAFMLAYSDITSRKLTGLPIYTKEAIALRAKMKIE